jgi:hypothetical protein
MVQRLAVDPVHCVGKTVDTAKLIATDMPRVLRSEPCKRERDDTL